MISEVNHRERIDILQELLRTSGISAALIQKPRNLYYYAGTGQPSNLWVPADGEPILFTRRAHSMAESAAWIERIHPANTFQDMLNLLEEAGLSPSAESRIAAELDCVPYKMIDRLQKDLGGAQLVNFSDIAMQQRLVKSSDEIEKIREAGRLWRLGHEAILQTVRSGQTEYQVAAAMEHACRSNGGDAMVWFHRWDAGLPGGGIVASGPNAWIVSGHAMTVTGVGMNPALPWGASGRVMERGDLVVVDYGVAKNSYHFDTARTYCIGKASDPQKELWRQLVELHFRVIDRVRAGVTGKELYETAVDAAKEMNLDNYFMGVGRDRGAYIGHTIGLEIDEWPVLGPKALEPLPANAVITVEPKFMIPGVGGVMVEDSILVKENGYELLGTIGHELFEIG
ncbi:M24 family metallopeptidase [Ferviditalea candida]|uniref:Xaa-Pro peptidase family protein n=1 Tax=Ferviditalea candida TaxID=3108399 RepID=A0ABU5ZJY5_9BACL|nr:Xaa-Pro peptidase family protein [Paenibacillaceae bacterium T2]